VKIMPSHWTALLGWAALMSIVWFLFVPSGLSAATFTLMCLTGPMLLVPGLMLWNAQHPSPSIRQTRARQDEEGRSRGDARTAG